MKTVILIALELAVLVGSIAFVFYHVLRRRYGMPYFRIYWPNAVLAISSLGLSVYYLIIGDSTLTVMVWAVLFVYHVLWVIGAIRTNGYFRESDAKRDELRAERGLRPISRHW